MKDWSVTGALIEKHRICLTPNIGDGGWDAWIRAIPPGRHFMGDDPHEAVQKFAEAVEAEP